MGSAVVSSTNRASRSDFGYTKNAVFPHDDGCTRSAILEIHAEVSNSVELRLVHIKTLLVLGNPCRSKNIGLGTIICP